MRVAALLTAAGLLLAAPFTAPLAGRSARERAARPGSAPASLVEYRAPVPGQVVRPFEPPPTPYAAGHRGVDLAAAPGEPVRAAGSGVVRFAGTVAGRGVLVLAHADGVTTEYEPVQPLVRAGQAVFGGAMVARVDGRHAGCAASCLHWGARRGGDYLDPLTLLRPLGPVVLLPWPRGG